MRDAEIPGTYDDSLQALALVSYLRDPQTRAKLRFSYQLEHEQLQWLVLAWS